jgi:MFS family permease
MSDPAPAPSPLVLFRHRPFALFFCARGLSEFCHQMAAVAVGWQVYALTDSAFALGLVGLVQFLPTAFLTFFAGHVADRYDRMRVAQVCQIIEALTAAYLAWGSFAGWLTAPHIFAAVALFGAAIAFENPATAALLPGVTPEGLLQKGTALSSGVFQVAMVSGPALGGVIYAFGPEVPYAVMVVAWLIAAVLNGLIRIERKTEAKERPTLANLFAGVGFVRADQAILGTISLDLVAVLLGGATALLPIYARDILDTGPTGLGILRGAPAVGALMMSAFLARYTIERKVGMRMFQAVMAFGLTIVVFALSTNFWLSLGALFLMGAADTVSVVIRISLVQLRTPDAMRGRVGAVNFLFVNASNQLGEFESGLVAALIGAMPAALVGGLGTIAVALLWMKLFPTLRDVDRLE